MTNTTIDITTALIDAGVDADAIVETPNGVITVLRASDGAQVSIAEDSEGEWWDYTRYSADDDIEGTDGSADLNTVARDIAAFINA